MTADSLAEHFFRHQYAKLVATLIGRVGPQWLDDIEDAVQQSLMKGLEQWSRSEVPDNPSAWLYRVAYNDLMGELRKRPRHRQLLQQYAELAETEVSAASELPLQSQIQDDLLRMMFACCDEAIPPQSSLVLALRVLCGFDVREIALRLFASEANIYKRLARARERLKNSRFEPGELRECQLKGRLSSVHQILYLLFTEGHLSHHLEHSLRRELCEEAIRLAEQLQQHPASDSAQGRALLALMYLHIARMDARDGGAGNVLLLEEQDRSCWDRTRIATGLYWLSESANGSQYSRYHAEAAIAAEHCLAPSFSATRWSKIAQGYEELERMAPSPIYSINRAVALAQWQGPAAALAMLEAIEPPAWLLSSYQWPAVLADLHRQLGNETLAASYTERALALASTEALKRALTKRLRAADVVRLQ